MTEWTWKLRATMDDSGEVTKMVIEDERGPLEKDWAVWDAEHEGTGRQAYDESKHEMVTASKISQGDRVAVRDGDEVRPAYSGGVRDDSQPTFKEVFSVDRPYPQVSQITFTDGSTVGGGNRSTYARLK
jgi:hypothetical protein